MRSSRTVNHKVLLFADATPAAVGQAAETGWGIGIRDLISPPFEALAAVAAAAACRGGADRDRRQRRVALVHARRPLDLGALDAVYLASDDPTVADARHVRLSFGCNPTWSAAVSPPSTSAASVSRFEEFQVWRQCCGGCCPRHRVADGRRSRPRTDRYGRSDHNQRRRHHGARNPFLEESQDRPIDDGISSQLALMGLTGVDDDIVQVLDSPRRRKR